MNKKFDCIKMKHELQEILYNKINPKNINDYFVKLNILSQNNELNNELKKQSEKQLILK